VTAAIEGTQVIDGAVLARAYGRQTAECMSVGVDGMPLPDLRLSTGVRTFLVKFNRIAARISGLNCPQRRRSDERVKITLAYLPDARRVATG
jgi:hypothetical protein